ncbi:eppin-like [Rousettus aegyptiacus]|uniref:eppin-like n=1 Tax=Rousettus aegyptiacus TaxID=9407 RepID=UPI00168D8BF5|nr:eppin-like [Rousettus aegyptiacus]
MGLEGRCPKIIERCRYRERDECEKDKECRWGKKCCEFSCGKKCLESRLGDGLNQTYARCQKTLAPAWLFFIVGGPRKNREQPPGFGLDPRLFV